MFVTSPGSDTASVLSSGGKDSKGSGSLTGSLTSGCEETEDSGCEDGVETGGSIGSCAEEAWLSNSVEEETCELSGSCDEAASEAISDDTGSEEGTEDAVA